MNNNNYQLYTITIIVKLIKVLLTLFTCVQAGSSRVINNFNEDIKDSEIYTDLIAQVAPKNVGVNKLALKKEVSNILSCV